MRLHEHTPTNYNIDLPLFKKHQLPGLVDLDFDVAHDFQALLEAIPSEERQGSHAVDHSRSLFFYEFSVLVDMGVRGVGEAVGVEGLSVFGLFKLV
jgi:hypothetical protein